MKKKLYPLGFLIAIFISIFLTLIIYKIDKLEDRMGAMVNEHNKAREEVKELVDKQKEVGEYTYTALIETVKYLEDVVAVYDDNVEIYNQNWEDQYRFNENIIDYLR